MAMTEMQRVTLEEFRTLPEGPPYYEYEEGEMILVASPTPEHQDVVGVLWNVLWQFVRQHQLGRVVMELDLYLPDGRAYIPDLAYLSTERLHLLSPSDRKIHGSPDLVVEVTSSTPARDRVHKFRVYYETGSPGTGSSIPRPWPSRNIMPPLRDISAPPALLPVRSFGHSCSLN